MMEQTHITTDTHKSLASSKSKNNPVVIGVCGGTASGKTTLAEKIRNVLLSQGHKPVMISQDSFYRNLTPEELKLVHHNSYNFDHPEAIDFGIMREVIKNLASQSDDIQIPVYDYHTHQRSGYKKITPGDTIIVEGLFIFSDPELRDMFKIKLFVEVDDDIRLARRIRRDISSRGRDIAQVLDYYEKFVKPGHVHFIEPSKRYSDIIVPWVNHNDIAVVMITQYLNRMNPSSGSQMNPSLDRK